MYGPCCFVYIHNVHAAPHRAPPAFSHTKYTPAACRRAVYDPRRIHPYRPIRRKLTLRAHTIYAICSYTALLSKSPRRAFSAASTPYACFLLMLCCLLHFRRAIPAYFNLPPAVRPPRAAHIFAMHTFSGGRSIPYTSAAPAVLSHKKIRSAYPRFPFSARVCHPVFF